MSALTFGLDVVAVDYWGDQDLKNCLENLIVIKDKIKKTDLDTSELLVSSAIDAIDTISDIEGILIGSGIDDRDDLWDKLNDFAPVLGNSSLTIKEVRNVINLYERAEKKGISCPFTKLVSSLKEAEERSRDIGFPLILKPFSGAGGLNIRIASKKDELISAYIEIVQKTKNEKVYLQEFIKGKDVSSMVLSTGSKTCALSFNEQLIGLKEVNAPNPFSYCGNIIPLDATKEVTKKISECSIKLSNLFGLRGINGIDFVLKDEIPYLMEINPRFPGTFELIENLLKINLIKLHLESCLGNLPDQVFSFQKYGVKFILFAKANYILPDLSNLGEIYDIPIPGTTVNKGSPICTVLTYGDSKKEAKNKGLKKVKKIYTFCEN